MLFKLAPKRQHLVRTRRSTLQIKRHRCTVSSEMAAEESTSFPRLRDTLADQTLNPKSLVDTHMLTQESLKRSTTEFLALMRTKPMAPEGKFYPLLHLPYQLTKLDEWIAQHKTEGCGKWFLPARTLEAAAFNSPLVASEMKKSKLRRVAKDKFNAVAKCFENNDFNQLFEHASPWAAEFLKGWDLHMNERKLWWRYRLHSLESVKFLGVSLIANYGGSLPDPVSGTKLSNWADGRYAIAIIQNEQVSLPREWYRATHIKEIFSRNQRGQSDLIAWFHFYTRERFEVFSMYDNKRVYFHDGPAEHVWKLGRRLPKAQTDVNKPAFQWKVLDFNNQVRERAATILKEDMVFPDTTPDAKLECWKQIIKI